jgi:DNA-binding FadR family transcriptional regulator
MATKPFRPIQGRRIFEEILDQLEQAILDGHISAGDRLPPERELAQRFNASRTSVREAVRVLEALGVAKVKAGAENGAVLVKEAGGALDLLLRFQLALGHISVESVIEFRTVMEPWGARTASERATEAEVDGLRTVLTAMAATDVTPDDFHHLDSQFHLEIAQAAQNELMVLVLEGARTSIERIMLDALRRVPDFPATRERLVADHAKIVDAIAVGNGDEAAALMERHIGSFYEDVGLARLPN